MEAQGCSEVRKLQIVYFLSRKGRIEHPHLVRVHHLSRSGVRLRDVKRWLGELRGNDMPEAYSWSYKRRYKTGYVWQDLLDDDLINPISDNEYVLKGSEVSSTIIKDEKVTKQKGQFLQEDTQTTVNKDENRQSHTSSETSMYISTKSSSEIEEESPNFGSETSTLTDDSIKKDDQMEKSSCKTKHEKNGVRTPPKNDDKKERTSPFYSALLSKTKNKKRSDKVTVREKLTSSAARHADNSKVSSSEPQLSKSCKINPNGPSNKFRNLITCGAFDTNDSAVVAVNKQINNNSSNKANLSSTCSSDLRNVHHSEEICKRDHHHHHHHHRIGRSQRVFGTPSWTQQQYWSCGRKSFDGVKDSLKNKSELKDQRVSSAANMPLNVPNCWLQCRKPFKPDKLHAHMKSCKGIKALSKTAAAISAELEKASKGSME
ncbi:hypothetical protein OROGR_030207 [Orobanche gracilis]